MGGIICSDRRAFTDIEKGLSTALRLLLTSMEMNASRPVTGGISGSQVFLSPPSPAQHKVSEKLLWENCDITSSLLFQMDQNTSAQLFATSTKTHLTSQIKTGTNLFFSTV